MSNFNLDKEQEPEDKKTGYQPPPPPQYPGGQQQNSPYAPIPPYSQQPGGYPPNPYTNPSAPGFYPPVPQQGYPAPQQQPYPPQPPYPGQQQYAVTGFPRQFQVQNDETKTSGILSIVFSIIFAPAGLIIGIMAWRKANRLKVPATLPAVGTILSGIFLLLNFFFFLLIFFAAFTSSTTNYDYSTEDYTTEEDTSYAADSEMFLAYVDSRAQIGGETLEPSQEDLVLQAGWVTCEELLNENITVESLYGTNISGLSDTLSDAAVDGATYYLCPEVLSY